MSALNFILQSDALFIATDTLAISGEDGSPRNFQSKIYPLLHLDGVLCGTGIGQFITRWYVALQSGILARNIPHLDQYVPNGLRSLHQELPLPEGKTTTIYHFGWDHAEGRFRGFAYRSEHDFRSEELQYGFGVKPQVAFTPTGTLPDDFVQLITLQRQIDNARPPRERIGIGGEIHFLAMAPGEISLTRCHSFEDLDLLYDQMCRRLPPPT